MFLFFIFAALGMVPKGLHGLMPANWATSLVQAFQRKSSPHTPFMSFLHSPPCCFFCKFMGVGGTRPPPSIASCSSVNKPEHEASLLEIGSLQYELVSIVSLNQTCLLLPSWRCLWSQPFPVLGRSFGFRPPSPHQTSPFLGEFVWQLSEVFLKLENPRSGASDLQSLLLENHRVLQMLCCQFLIVF